MFCFVLVMSLSFLFCVCFFRCVLRYTGKNASYLGSCLCAYALRRKKEKRKIISSLPQISRLNGVWWQTHLPAWQLSQIQYRNASLFSLLPFSRSRGSLRAQEINHVWEQACPILGSNLTSEECHYTLFQRCLRALPGCMDPPKKEKKKKKKSSLDHSCLSFDAYTLSSIPGRV